MITENRMEKRMEVDALKAGTESLRKAIPRAAAALVECLESPDLRVRLRAAEAILNRAGLCEAKSPTPEAAKFDVGGFEPIYGRRGD